ncbi:MAG: hypothetical protein P8R54_22235 [Myxococcota bacterium]|nr:hypothetical protein [Myxococcota bacterium]
MLTVDALLSLPRHPCQSCYRSMPDFATVCAQCRVVQDPSLPAARHLPQLYQDNLDHRSREDNIIYVVLPSGCECPDVHTVIDRLLAGRVLIHDIGDAEQSHGHRPLWERQLFAEPPERPRRSWETSTEGVRARRGDRVHVWLEETGLPLDMGLDIQRQAAEDLQKIRDSEWTIGLHCDTAEAPPWNTLMLMRLVGQLLPGPDSRVIEAATGRILSELWREAAEVRPPAVRDCYSVLVSRRDGVAWVRTRGLPRWGCFELEILACAADRISEATGLIHAVAAALVSSEQLPPPWRPHYFRNGAAFSWVPFEQVAERFPEGIPGTLPEDRRQLKHATVLLISPYFGPEIFQEIASLPAPPAVRSLPDAAPSPEASSPPPLPAAEHPQALAAFISFVLPGAAQLWLGQRTKGSVMLVVGLLTCGGLGLLSVASAYDAWRLSGRLARGEQPGEWDWF